MSRLVGIVALVIAFSWSGFIAWRLLAPRTLKQSRSPVRIRAVANLGAVHEDLCDLAQAEVNYERATGHYADANELRSNGFGVLMPETRWPYRYMIHVPAPETFVITAVAEAPLFDQPSVFLIDDRLEMTTRTHPVKVFPCRTSVITQAK
jgi:hypothetical protein